MARAAKMCTTALCSSGIFQFGGREPDGRGGALIVATARAHPLMPRRRKSSSPVRASGGRAPPRTAPRKASYCITSTDDSANCSCGCSSGSFFSGDRSFDRPGVDVEVELLPNQLRELASSHGLARYQLLLDERQRLPPKLVRAAGAALLWRQSSNAGSVEAGLGLVVCRPRHAVLLGGGAHRRVFDRDPAQHLVLNLNDVVRIEELVVLKLRIANMLGSRV